MLTLDAWHERQPTVGEARCWMSARWVGRLLPAEQLSAKGKGASNEHCQGGEDAP